jgi:hypothetical protein
MGENGKAHGRTWANAWLAVLILVVTGLAGCTVMQSPGTGTAGKSAGAKSAAPEQAATAATPAGPVARVPGNGAKALFFGDSWTAGYGATPVTRGYAYLTGQALGWDYKVNGVNGTGYLKPGSHKTRTYLGRIGALAPDSGMQVVVLQGGLNDESQSLSQLPDAASAAVDLLRAKYPEAVIVMLGPGAAILPADENLRAVDSMLQLVAQRKGLAYISPLSAAWITPDNYSSVIDVAAAHHPSTTGHAYLARRTVAALRALQ